MFNIIVGFILGSISSTGLFYVLSVFYIKIDLAIITNVIIAVATVVATVIHFDSQKKSRRDRIWDINKKLLLELTHSISEVIEETENTIHEIYCQDEIYKRDESNRNVFKELSQKIQYALNVYKPLMSNELINSIKMHQEKDQEITSQVNNHELEISDAYEEMLVAHKRLYKDIEEFIAKISGVKYT